MNYLFALLIFLSPFISAQQIVQVKFSKPFAIVKFLETSKGARSTSITFKHQIDTSFLSKDKVFQDLVSKYQALNLDYSYSKNEYPSLRKHYTSTWDLLCIAAISSNTNDEFFDRIIGIYPNTDFLKLKRIVNEAEPFYDRFVFNNFKSKIDSRVKEMQGLSPKLNDLFEKFKVFYGSSWDKSMPFNLTIYPIIGRRGQTTATPHANSLEMGVLTHEEDIFDLLSIGAHEMCHVLYDEQPLKLQQQLDSMFTDSINPNKKYAYHYIDEALATALGNGYAYKYLTNELDSAEWYSDSYINTFSKAIYPLTEQYVNNKQQVDKPFISKTIDIFKQTFPNAMYDLEPLLMTTDVYFENDSTETIDCLENYLHNSFRIYSSNTSIPIIDKDALNSIKNSKETQLLVVHKNQTQIISNLKLMFKSLINLPPYKNMIVSFLDKNKRAVIIIFAENKIKALEGIKLLKSQKEIDPKKLWTKF